jgi:hypothetical protein
MHIQTTPLVVGPLFGAFGFSTHCVVSLLITEAARFAGQSPKKWQQDIHKLLGDVVTFGPCEVYSPDLTPIFSSKCGLYLFDFISVTFPQILQSLT